MNNAISLRHILWNYTQPLATEFISGILETCEETMPLTSVNLPKPSTYPQEVSPLSVSPITAVTALYKWGHLRVIS